MVMTAVVRDAQLRRDNVPDRESGRRSRVIGHARREIIRLRSQLKCYKELAEMYRRIGNICWGCNEIITDKSDYHEDLCWRCERQEFGH